MNSILHTIAEIRKDKQIVIDYKNNNRYRIVLKEPDGTLTGYYFSTPIYNKHSRKIVDLKFKQNGNHAYAYGSNAKIIVAKDIILENDDGRCILRADKYLSCFSARKLKYGEDILLPTTNGILYNANCIGGVAFTFELELDKPFMEVESNNKCFVLKQEKFKPFVSVTCVGTTNSSGEVIAPAMITYKKINDLKYSLTIIPCSEFGERIMFEFNLYEPKLIQDTTVESLNPKMNNVFGSTAFIGYTTQYGEQWLYLRPDLTNFTDLKDKYINSVILHMPQYNCSNTELSALKILNRFCSFGSNWDNKVAFSDVKAEIKNTDKYQKLDVTKLLVDVNGDFINSEGVVLKPKKRKSNFSVIATGDSYYAPQILEINFK